MTHALNGIQTLIAEIPTGDDYGVKAAEALFAEAQQRGFSDLQLRFRQDDALVRGRKDDAIFPVAVIPPKMRDLLLARVKVLAKLPAYVRNEPQDGRVEWQSPDGRRLLLRVAFLPTIHGETVTIRFPESRDSRLVLEDLGMDDETLAALRSAFRKREGTLLVTGPAGSGKTTTLYAMLDDLYNEAGERLNFLTIEDPVERALDYASQVQVNEAQGVTFAKGLRAAMRQSPDVLLIGEIRDLESARIAIQAGMSGHLALSTVHAGRACRVYTRLLAMDVEPYMAASALSGALAQRLLRRICRDCAGAGCGCCSGSGYTGRIGVFEFAPMTERIRQLILSRSLSSEIAQETARVQTADLISRANTLAEQRIVSRTEVEFAFAGEEELL